MKQKISVLLCVLFVQLAVLAQTDGNKTGDITKDLNAIERENIKSIDLKQKPTTPATYKKIDTSDIDMFSTKPIIKGAPVKTPVKPKEAVIDLSIKKPEGVKKDSVKVQPVKQIKKDTETVKPTVPAEIKKPAPVKKDSLIKQVKTKTDSIKAIVKPVKDTLKTVPKKSEDFSTKPIIKGKQIAEEKKQDLPKPVQKPVYKIDTTKNFKEFSFETTPVINKNATYNRKDEPMPKSKEQLEEAIPVNKTAPASKDPKQEAALKETYAQYTKEADSLYLANKRVLDSVMKSLNIKVPTIINPADYIDIYMSGGGVLSGKDARIYDHISILNSGVIQREYKTAAAGVQRTEKKISRDELTKLAQYMVDMEFFEMNKSYDCADTDDDCNARFGVQPQPVPLTIALTVGQKKNKVNVAIFSPKTDKNWVNYPAAIEKIWNAIITIAEK